jgi:hypothetical protein
MLKMVTSKADRVVMAVTIETDSAVLVPTIKLTADLCTI